MRRERCRPVELPGGQVVILRGDREPTAEGVAAFAEIVAAAQRLHEQTHPQDPATVELYTRLDEARVARGVTWRGLSRLAGVSASALTRLAQGTMPPEQVRDALETWLAHIEPTEEPPADTLTT